MALKTGKQQSADTRRFAMVPRNDVPRSAFDIQHTHKTTFDSGFLVPIYVDEVLPGDSIRLRMTAFARLATAIVPIMDNLILESFFFFVPNRLVWDNWQRFMGEQVNPVDSTVFLVPQVSINAAAVVQPFAPGGLADYMGVTMNGAASGTLLVNALPFRAYNLIFNEWFRDEDLDAPLVVPTNDGPDDYATIWGGPVRRRKRHDYFTTCRPWPQKPLNMIATTTTNPAFTAGGEMMLPQAGAPVSGLGVAGGAVPSLNTTGYRESGGRTAQGEAYSTATVGYVMRTQPPQGQGAAAFPNVRVLINDIRTANVVQLLMERNARGGTRYAEIIRTHFGVVSPDARLQRPEYLGGGRTNVVVNPVAQTSGSGTTGSTTALGELAGVGTAVASGHGFSSSFTEHGVILGLVQVRADLTYQQGVSRMWFRRTQFEFYWPALANLGEQAVLSREIFCDGTSADQEVFGYQERWSEYKYKPNRVSGHFRSTTAQPIDIWHLAQHFTARPVLNNAFMEDNPPVDRILAVETEDRAEQFLFDSVFDVRMVRCMPMHSIPGLGPRL